MGLRILVAEDNPFNYELIQEFLAGRGHEVVWAPDGWGALALATSRPFDVALVDIHMPRIDGLQLVTALRRQVSTADLKLVVVTADAMPSVRQEVMAAGADGYLTKPLDLNLLAAEIVRVTARRPVQPATTVETELADGDR